jgi:hypothetical protein
MATLQAVVNAKNVVAVSANLLIFIYSPFFGIRNG